MKIKFKNSFKIEHFRFISTASCLFLRLDYEWNVMVSFVVKLEFTTIYICFKRYFQAIPNPACEQTVQQV